MVDLQEREREPQRHVVRQGDTVGVVLTDPATGEEMELDVVVLIYYADHVPKPGCVQVGEIQNIEYTVSEASSGLILTRLAAEEMLARQAEMAMRQRTGLAVPGGPGVRTPGGVFRPGPPAGRRRKDD